MRRTTVTLTAALMLLAFAPASALARHHHNRRHHRHARHARIERFGRDVTSATHSSADNAGTVQSFSGGKLTIMLGDGASVSGMVTKDTELECMAPEQSQTTHEDGDTGSGDQSGSGDGQADGSDDQSSGQDQAADQNDNEAEDQAEDQNENEAAEQNENEAQNNCSTASLTHGAVVGEAELRISSAGNVWKKVELES